jgi:hypothetical protein
MGQDRTVVLKFFAPKLMAKVVQSFDRTTTLIVSVCWGIVAFLAIAAIYTLMLSASARHAADDAMAAEPVLPKMVHNIMDIRNVQKVYERMQKRFPEIEFSVRGSNLMVASKDGARFRQWLMAMGYMDTISPEYHWSIQELCVGQCGSANQLMQAILAGDHITFEAPKSKQ